jgi:hypothetical protein
MATANTEKKTDTNGETNVRSTCNRPLQPQVEAFRNHRDSYSAELLDASGFQYYR